MQHSEWFQTLHQRSLHWLAQREQSEAELRRKLLFFAQSHWPGDRFTHRMNDLQSSGLNLQNESDPSVPLGAPQSWPDVINQVIDSLKALGYLSDQRFIESRVRVRQSRVGLQRIQRELAEHGLSLEENTLSELAASEFKRAHSVWRRKFNGLFPCDPVTRARQTRFLMQRGFSIEVIRRVFSKDDNSGDEFDTD